MIRLATVSLLAVGALAFAAPSIAASASDWSKAADKICARTNADIDRIPEPGSTKALIAATEKILALGARQTSDLAKLKRPSGDATTIAQLVGNYEQQVGSIKALIAALRRDDQLKVAAVLDQVKVKAVLAQGNALESKANALATKLGAKKCAD